MNNKWTWQILKIPVLILSFNAAYGSTFYVDGNLGGNCAGDYSIANRACNGTDGNAYNTLAAGFAALTDADTLNIRAGIYTAGVRAGDSLTIPVSSCDDVGATTTVQAYSSESVILQATLWDTNLLKVSANCDDLTIRGIEFAGVRPATANEGGNSDDFWGVAIRASGSGLGGNIKIENNIFREWAHAGIKAAGPNWIIRNNYFYNIGGNLALGFGEFHDHALYLSGNAQSGSLIEYNRFGANIGGGAVHLYVSPSFYTIRYNVFEGGDSNYWGILLACKNCEVYGNSFYNYRHGIMIFRATAQSSVIKNNLFYGNRECDIAVDTAGGSSYPVNNTVENNYFGSSKNCPNNAGDQTALGGDDYTTYNDPPNIVNSANPFVAASPSTWLDFVLNSSSAAIDAGAALAAAHDDAIDPNGGSVPPTTVFTLDQDSFGSGWEIGAFGHVGTTPNPPTPPNPPTNLRNTAN